MVQKKFQKYKNFLKKNFFDKQYSQAYDKWTKDPFGNFIEKRQNKAFFELIENKPNSLILDLGAGTGKYELFLNKITAKKSKGFIVAMDFSPAMIEKMKKNLKGKKLNIPVFIVRGEAEHLPFKPGVFDEVFSMNTLQYVPHDKKYFSELYRVLKKGGNAVIDAVSKTELRMGCNLILIVDKIRKLFGKKKLNIYSQIYFPWTFSNRFKQNKFKIHKFYGVIFSLPFWTRDHLGITLPSPQHIVIFFPQFLKLMWWIEERIKSIQPFNWLCTHFMIKAVKK